MFLNLSLVIKSDKARKQIRVLQRELTAKEISQATYRAINHTLGKARTIARREVKQVYNISQKNLDAIKIKPASLTNLTGKLVASRKPIPLDAFAPKQETGDSTRRITKRGALKVTSLKRTKSNPIAGISIEVKKGEREVIPYAFLIPGGAVRVFARGEYRKGTQHGFVERHVRVNSTGSDTPVKPLITVSIFGSVINSKVLRNIARDVRIVYPDRYMHELQYIVSKAAIAANNTTN